jgi:hypothetical protein
MKKTKPSTEEFMLHLPAPFSRCTVCGGTTTLCGVISQHMRKIQSVCYSCDSHWDLQGNLIAKGTVTALPYIEKRKTNMPLAPTPQGVANVKENK